MVFNADMCSILIVGRQGCDTTGFTDSYSRISRFGIACFGIASYITFLR